MEESVFLSMAFLFLVPITVFGFLGNCLVLQAVLRHKKRQLNDFLILNLSVTDFGVCVISIPLDLVQMLTKRFPFGEEMCHLIFPFQSMLLYVSVMTLLFMSWERYRLVVTPMKDKISVKKGQAVIAAIWLLSLLITLPYSLSLRMVGLECIEDWPSPISKEAFTLGVFIFLYVIPLFVISVLYAFVVRVLYQDIKRLSTPSNCLVLTGEMTIERIQRNLKIVKIFVLAVVAFAVCMLPTHVCWLWHDFGSGKKSGHFVEIVTFSNVVMYLNSLINPFIFGSLNLSRLFVKVIACCRAVEASTTESVFVMRNHPRRLSHRRQKKQENGELAGVKVMRKETSV